LKELLPKYITSNKGLKKALQALSNMREVYATLTFARQGKNSLFINVLVTTMVSNVDNTSQQHIAKAIGATRYMVWKVIECCVHVDETGEKLWGVLPRKWHCDMMIEGDHETMLKWWETSTIVSLIHKDVKKRCISAKVFDKHPIHYLQES
jgi:hypothetical protein